MRKNVDRQKSGSLSFFFSCADNDGSPHFSLFTSNIYFYDWMFQFKRDKLLEETSATLSFHIYSLHIHNIRRQCIYSYRSESLCVYREKLHSELLGSFSFSIRNCNFLLRDFKVQNGNNQSPSVNSIFVFDMSLWCLSSHVCCAHFLENEDMIFFYSAPSP